jgi:inner membrane protein
VLGRTHALTGLFVGLLVISVTQVSLVQSFFLVLTAIFGSLLPDIDSPKAYLGRKIKIISWISKHRGIFHSVIPLAIGYFSLQYVVGQNYAFAFAAGFLSHLILDMITKEGIRLFPFGFHIRGPIKVGGFAEYIFLLAQIFFIVFLFY